MPASMSANFEMNPDSGGMPARLSADTRNIAARKGVVRTMPPIRLSRLEPLGVVDEPADEEQARLDDDVVDHREDDGGDRRRP